jgi:hypothetical protein
MKHAIHEGLVPSPSHKTHVSHVVTEAEYSALLVPWDVIGDTEDGCLPGDGRLASKGAFRGKGKECNILRIGLLKKEDLGALYLELEGSTITTQGIVYGN